MSHKHDGRRRPLAIRTTLALLFGLIVAGAAVPAIRSEQAEHRTEIVADLVERVERACRDHRRDTGLLAIEMGAPEPGHLWAGSSFHRLGMKQGYEGWNGPYLEHPLVPANNPFGGNVTLRSQWSEARDLGFNCTPDSGFGQYMVFDRVDEGAARRIESRLDGSLDGREAAYEWSRFGRVRWTGKDGGRLLILLDIGL